MNEDLKKFLIGGSMGEGYLKQKGAYGTNLEIKLSKYTPNVPYTKENSARIEHIKSRITKARIAGFGGWKEYVPSDSKKLKEYEQNLSKSNKEKFYECCRVGKERFITWYVENYYEKEEKTTCCYCGVTEQNCADFFKSHRTKRDSRGLHLEIERKDSQSNLYEKENCALACYICNNAKSDFISEADFREYVVPGIQKFWKSKREDKGNCK